METYIDIHSHILAGVDDGAADLETSMKMLHIAADNGISQIVLTPHNKPGHRKIELTEMAAKVEELREKLLLENLDMKLYMGNELYYRSGLAEEIENGLVGTLAGSRYVLVEFNPSDDFGYIRNGIYTLLMSGYLPILAHVERYQSVCAKKAGIADLIEMGCLIQVNAGSIMGKFGFRTWWFTRKILKQRLVHFVATDAHDLGKRAPALMACADYIRKKLGEDYCKKLFCDNPMCVLEDKYLTEQEDK